MIYGVLGLLGVWTALYGKRSQAEGERREAEAIAAGAAAADPATRQDESRSHGPR
ncbi:hypothetical protein OHS70_08670 [Streptomyces sp. NBC_00390]